MMGDTFMRCSECKLLFAAEFMANVEYLRGVYPKTLMLCPVCRLEATQRGISESL